ncbi:thaumatin-like protein 1b [Tasmannia lanceolata]|uniref:thaumatin-like protein 1b n=1 Tax=Tasmannia lanceolata TaxID=3420 RepID=UPI004063F340
MDNGVLFLTFLLAHFVAGAYSTTFTFTNKCNYTVWAGTLSGSGSPPLSQTGFQLNQGVSTSLAAPVGWSGRFWGRTHCSSDSAGKFKCATGDCGKGSIPCSGAGAIPPATLVEFTLGKNGGQDFYDTSLVDGYNLPFSVGPQGGTGNCRTSGCPSDLNAVCPPELQLTGSNGSIIGCKSACEAFGDPKYCCTGDYGSPTTCKPTNYSKIFKKACPLAYSYAYDDASSTFTCTGANYALTFCP